MKITNLTWLTDLHLNFLNQSQRLEFYQTVAAEKTDGVLITGDIAEAPTLVTILTELLTAVGRPIFFVLGNHDYYFGSINEVREVVTLLSEQNAHLTWLQQSDPIQLSHDTVLLGVDGWADGRNGDFMASPVALNDSRIIEELLEGDILGKASLLATMQSYADDDAAILAEQLTLAASTQPASIIIATHVPPYRGCCWYNGQPSNNDWVPYFSSRATGDVILNFAQAHPQINCQVLCGHTHTRHTETMLPNLIVKVGGARYHQPNIAGMIPITTV